jgi:glycosyltransferase involved in cell wall biosynthesis
MAVDRRKVVLSVAYPISETDGTTVRARQVIGALVDEFEVSVLSRPGKGGDEYADSLKAKGVGVVLRPSRKKLWPVRVIQSIPALRPDLVYCSADLYGFLALVPLSKIMGFKLVYEAHALAGSETIQFSTAKGLIYYLMECLVGGSADAVVALSLKTRGFFRRVNRRTEFIPVFVDTHSFAPGEARPPGEEKVVGLIGPFDNLFNAYQLEFLTGNLKRFDSRMRFLLIGSCPSVPSDSRISSTGYLPSLAEYAAAVRGLDALLVPVDKATYGPKNKVLEAMASEVPVFMTPEAAVGLDFAENTKNAFVIPKEELVERMNRLLFDDSVMRKVASRGRETVIEWYERGTCARMLESLVKRMTSRPSGQ